MHSIQAWNENGRCRSHDLRAPFWAWGVVSLVLVGLAPSTSLAQGLGKSRYGTAKPSVPDSEKPTEPKSVPDPSAKAAPARRQSGETSKTGSRAATKGESDEASEGSTKDAIKDPGQGKDAKDNAEGENPERPRGSLFGDTSRFNRVSGWGSIGAGMGQYGFSRSMLIMLPPVQEELKLTEEQKKQLRDWSNQMRKRGEDWGRSMRERNEGNDPFRNPNLPLAARILQFTTIMNQVSGLLKENETGFGRILTAAQRKRLNEISLQMEGVSALGRPEVAKALYLHPLQTENIQKILAQSRMMQMTTWIEKMTTMAMKMPRRPPGEDSRGFGDDRGGGSRREYGEPTAVDRERDSRPGRETATDREQPPGPDGSRPEVGATKAKAKDASQKTAKNENENENENEDEKPVDPAEEARKRAERAKRAEEFRKEFESMRDTTDEIQDRTTRELLRVLTKRQRTSFERMLGEPFDPAKINTMGRPPSSSGPGGRPQPRGDID